jgi:hypothetical protein
MAAQQAAAAAPPKPVDGYVPTRFISDVFCTAAPATPSAAGEGAVLRHVTLLRVLAACMLNALLPC